jgi:hypothetical protein
MAGRVKQLIRKIIRAILSWVSLLAIPIGIGVGLKGYRTLGALLIFGGTAAYFLVDPILMVLDLLPSSKTNSRKD